MHQNFVDGLMFHIKRSMGWIQGKEFKAESGFACTPRHLDREDVTTAKLFIFRARLALALVAKMGCLGKKAFLLALLTIMQVIRADSGDYDYDDDYYDDDDDWYSYHIRHDDPEDKDEDYQEKDTDCAQDSGQLGYNSYEIEKMYEVYDIDKTKAPSNWPGIGIWNQVLTPMCNNENCWIRVDWLPPERDSTSSLLHYRVAFRKWWDKEGRGGDWTWLPVEGVFQDLRSNVQFFFEEPEGTNHSMTIQNLDFETKYEVKVEVFNTFAWTEGPGLFAITPPASYHT